MCKGVTATPGRLVASRRIIARELEADPDLKRAYIDNISCVLLDTGIDAFLNKQVRDSLSLKILDRIIKE